MKTQIDTVICGNPENGVPDQESESLFSAMLKRQVTPVFIILLMFFVSGCGWLGGPTITVSWKTPKDGLVPRIALQCKHVTVGHVVKVERATTGVVATVRLQKQQAHLVRTKSDFLFHPASASSPAFIELLVLDKESTPAPSGTHFDASDGAAEFALKWLTTDWKHTALLLGLGAFAILMTIFLVRLVLKLWALVASVLAGLTCATYFGQVLGQQLGPILPPGSRPDLIGYVVAFFIGIVGASLLLGVVFKPFRRSPEPA